MEETDVCCVQEELDNRGHEEQTSRTHPPDSIDEEHVRFRIRRPSRLRAQGMATEYVSTLKGT